MRLAATLRRWVPSRSMALLLGVGIVDLLSTAWLHSQGLILELNPLMRALLERSEWLFAAVKGATLLALWVAMVRHWPTNPTFVRRAGRWGAIAYLSIWATWVAGATHFGP